MFRPYQDENANEATLFIHDPQDSHNLTPLHNYSLSSSREKLFLNETISEIKNEDSTDLTPIHFDSKKLNLSGANPEAMDTGLNIKIENDPDLENHESINTEKIFQVNLHSTE